MIRRRSLALAMVVLLVGMAVPGAGAGAVAAQDGTATATPTPTPTPTATPTTTPTPGSNATATPAPNASTAPPGSAAAGARVLPVQFRQDWLGVETVRQGQQYNTTGPFALFSISEPVDRAVITQPKASAQALEGGRQVRVSYQDDAAKVGQRSYYELTLYFRDGTARTIELGAQRTSVDPGSGQMRKYRPALMSILNDAEKAGYERSPEGLENYHASLKEKAQLLESLFVEQAARLVAAIAAIGFNPLGLALGLLSVAGLSWALLKRRGWALDLLSNAKGKSRTLREKLWLEYKKRQQTAAEERLREIDEIGEMGEIYWKDAFGVTTTAQLAELAAEGITVERDGQPMRVGGVADLEADHLRDSWLEAVCREHRLPAPEIALSHLKKVLERMSAHYGMGARYDAPLSKVEELLDELDESKDITQYAAHSVETTGSGDPAPGGAAAGGDD